MMGVQRSQLSCQIAYIDAFDAIYYRRIRALFLSRFRSIELRVGSANGSLRRGQTLAIGHTARKIRFVVVRRHQTHYLGSMR